MIESTVVYTCDACSRAETLRASSVPRGWLMVDISAVRAPNWYGIHTGGVGSGVATMLEPKSKQRLICDNCIRDNRAIFGGLSG